MILGSSEKALAIVSCYQPAIPQIAGPRAVADQVLKTNVVGPEDRRTLKDFAKETGEKESVVAQRYAASGDLLCGTALLQASVVLKSDLILVSGHALYDKRDCERSVDLKTCKAYFIENGKRVGYDIAKEEAEGFACPDNSTMKSHNDWAILRLKKPVNSLIKPYAIEPAPCASDDSPATVTVVAKSKDFGKPASGYTVDAPRHYGRCQIFKGICGKPTYPIMRSDCDIDHGGSGAGAFVGDVEPRLIGILAGMKDSCPARPSAKAGPYNEDCWSTTIVPIGGELQDKLERLAHE